MTYITNKLFLLEVVKGNVAGHSVVRKSGRNDVVPNGSFELVSLTSGATSFLSAPTAVRIKAGGDPADDAAGTGARAITVIGIDDNLVEVAETITTAGAAASAATTANFWRVYETYVSAGGTYGASNAGDITIENSAGGTDLIMIGAEQGEAQYAAHTIPLGHTGFFLSSLVTVDAGKAADIRLCTRANFNNTTAPVSPVRIGRYWDGVLGVLPFNPRTPIPLFALTDIWFEAEGDGAQTEVTADFELLVVKN